MKQYLCIEDGETFVMEAESLAQAREDASIYNAEVIEELKGWTIECSGCGKTEEVYCKPSQSHWARSDYHGIYTGVYCDECYDDPSKYTYRKDDYSEDAHACGERIFDEDF